MEERIGLLGDRWALMQAGEGSVGEFLDLALGVKADPSATVLESASGKDWRDWDSDCDGQGPQTAGRGGSARVRRSVCGVGQGRKA